MNNVQLTMELEKHNMEMDKVSDSMSGLFQDACVIIEQARTTAYRAVNETLIKRNWLLGMRIQHEVLKDKRAEYGEQVIRVLAKNLTLKYGAGYSRNNLYRYLSFYKSFPNIFQSVSGKSEIVPSLTGQSKTVPSVTGLSDQSDLYKGKTRLVGCDGAGKMAEISGTEVYLIANRDAFRGIASVLQQTLHPQPETEVGELFQREKHLHQLACHQGTRVCD